MVDNTILTEATRECVSAMRGEMRSRMLKGQPDADDMVREFIAAMGRLTRRLGELAGPEVAEEFYFPVVLTLLIRDRRGTGGLGALDWYPELKRSGREPVFTVRHALLPSGCALMRS